MEREPEAKGQPDRQHLDRGSHAALRRLHDHPPRPSIPSKPGRPAPMIGPGTGTVTKPIA